MNQELINKFTDTILNAKKPSKKTVDGKEIWCRCPYCGDSSKHTNHGHFYIKLKPPFMFYCQKCTERGVLTNNTLRDLGIDSPDLFIVLAELNSEYEKSEEYVPMQKKKVLIQNVYKTDVAKRNLEYINKRFDLNMDEEYVHHIYRAILDAPQFFKDNGLTPVMNFDFQNSVGFVSSDQSHISFRDTSNTNPLRYIIYTVNDFGTKTCLLRRPVNSLASPLNVHITEGVFDLMGVHEFLVNKNEDDHIFVASCGKSYLRGIKTIINKGFLNLNIHIYSDADVSPSFFQRLKEDNVEFKYNNVNLYYNELEKDFGVSKQKIQIRRGVI